MISALFDKSFLYDILILAVVILLIIFAIKSKAFRFVLITVVYLLVIVTGILSYFQINKYLKASGGVIGEITDIFTNKNELEQNDLKFDFKNVVLKQNGDCYEAKFISDNVVTIEDSNLLDLYINNRKIDIQEFNKDYLIADFNYNFYDVNKNLILNDTLMLRFAFYEKQTTFIVQTNGNSEASKKWSYFFNKNGFVVELKKNPDKTESSLILSQFVKLDFTLAEESDIQTLKTLYLKPGRKISSDFKINSNRYNITGWKKDTESIDIFNTVFNENTTLTAVYSFKTFSVNFTHFNGPEDTTTKTIVFNGEDVLKANIPVIEDYKAIGYSADNNTMLPENYTVIKNQTVDVIWTTSHTLNEINKVFILSAFKNKYPDYTINLIEWSDVTFDETNPSSFEFIVKGEFANSETTVTRHRRFRFICFLDMEQIVPAIKEFFNQLNNTTLNNSKLFNFSEFKGKCEELTKPIFQLYTYSPTSSSDGTGGSSAGGGTGGGGSGGR